MTLLDLQLLLIILAANAAPILATHVGKRLPATAVDLDWRFFDGRRLFGPSKTWRGIISALLLGSLTGLALGLEPGLCLGMAALAMLGDLFSSFTKRRLGLAPSTRYMLLDQVPESLLPMLFAGYWLELSAASVLWVVCLFFILELVVSPLAYRLKIRKRPY